MKVQSLRLQESLRSSLKTPLGELIEGSIEETGPILKSKLKDRDYLLIGVGDVTAEILINLDLEPEIIVTDGYTKREELDEWVDYTGYQILQTRSPPAIISDESWSVIKEAISKVMEHGSKIHIKVAGEEDLLVLPFILELHPGATVIYGQPNTGAVIRKVNSKSKSNAIEIMEQMEKL